MATILATQTQGLSSTSLSKVYNEAGLTYNSAGVLYDNTNTWVDISNTDFLSISINGTFVGTWVFEVSLDNVNWNSFAMHQTSSTTATTDVTTGSTVGFYSKQCSGVRYFRCFFSAYTSGTASIVVTKSILDK
jgi:hypothetical protein